MDDLKDAVERVKVLEDALNLAVRMLEAMTLTNPFTPTGQVAYERLLSALDRPEEKKDVVWDENAQRAYTAAELKALLESRDSFLASRGLFTAYVDSLPEPTRPLASQEKGGRPELPSGDPSFGLATGLDAVPSTAGDRIHELKTWPAPFAAVRSGLKPWELRYNDRDFRVGEVLRLLEWCPEVQDYSGAVEERRVTWMLPGGQFGLPAGYVIMTLSDVRVHPQEHPILPSPIRTEAEASGAGELLPCPFCRSERVSIRKGQDHWALCASCEAEGPKESTEPLAIAAWNRRATPSGGAGQLREKVARIVDPRGWSTFDRQSAELSRMRERGDDVPPEAIDGPLYYTRDSLAKADAILSLLEAPTPSGEVSAEDARRSSKRLTEWVNKAIAPSTDTATSGEG